MKKKLIILLIITITLFITTVNSMAQYNGTDNIVTLTLEEAVKAVVDGNSDLKQCILELEQQDVQYTQNARQLKDAKRMPDKMKTLDIKKNIDLLEFSNEYNKLNTQRNYQAILNKLKADVKQAYFGVLHAQQAQIINEENLNITNDLYEITKEKFDMGHVSRQQVLGAELGCIKAQNKYRTAENMLKTAKMSLNMLLGYNLMTEIEPTDELTYTEYHEVDIEDMVQKAIRSRNEIKSMEYLYEIEKINMEYIKKQFPEMTYSYKEQEIALSKASEALENIKRAIEFEVRKNYADLLEKQKEIVAGMKTVEIAKEALQISRNSYELGMTLINDVENAQKIVLEAKLGLSQDILNYKLAISKFEDSVGVGRMKIGK